MIRRGKAEGWLRLPADELPLWASLNGISFDKVKVGPVAGKEDRGLALIAQTSISADEPVPLIRVPKDISLSAETVELHAKSDKHLREVLDCMGDFGKTARGAILVFLLVQATIACPDVAENVGLRSPLTEYVKFLPMELLPTFWSDAERDLLYGTTLEAAMEAKMKSLYREFDHLRIATEGISWCQKYWWNEIDGLVSFDDWKQVDAMYRSRALEFPGMGDSMIACIDMANHASNDQAVALYEADWNGDGLLLLREGKSLRSGDEITITYGDDKGACEMAFSYGFVEHGTTTAKSVFLDLQIPEDDPLRKAKHAVSNCAPGVLLMDTVSGTQWESDYIWLVCVNEEDGLEFCVMQTTEGARELQVAWKDAVLQDTSKLKASLESDSLWDLFQLRAVSIIQDRVGAQLRRAYSGSSPEESRQSEGALVREHPRRVANRLKELETQLLERAYGDLEAEKSSLLEASTVQDYLRSAALRHAADPSHQGSAAESDPKA